MNELMGEQPSSFMSTWGKLSRPECDVLPDGESPCAHLLGAPRSAIIRVNAHVAEIMSEALLHVLPQRWLQRPAGTCKNVVDTGGRSIHLPTRLSRQTLDTWRCAAVGGMCRPRHHLIGDPVRFPFVDIARVAHLELAL
jgi:hypothetical protein